MGHKVQLEDRDLMVMMDFQEDLVQWYVLKTSTSNVFIVCAHCREVQAKQVHQDQQALLEIQVMMESQAIQDHLAQLVYADHQENVVPPDNLGQMVEMVKMEVEVPLDLME